MASQIPPPPEVPDDAVAEILLRLPPDEPRCLFRASLVCKPWQRLLTDAAFLRRYRRFHRTPPLLGYFFVGDVSGETIPCFVPTTAASPFPSRCSIAALGSLSTIAMGVFSLQTIQEGEDYFIVWDPITGGREELLDPVVPHRPFSVALLCAVAGCDHRDCHGGPFLVVWVWTMHRQAYVRVYSSEVGHWGWDTPVSVGLGVDDDFLSPSRGTLAGDHIYFMLQMGARNRILNYDLVKPNLSIVDPPESYDKAIVIVPTEDGLLGVAGIKGSTLCLWSRKANAEGFEGWVQYRVIELRNLLPVDNHLETAAVVAFVEGVRVILVCTEVGHFIIDLRSEQARKVSQPGVQYTIVPFMSFYTPDCACGNFRYQQRKINHCPAKYGST